MAATTYTYSIADDFPSGKCDAPRLTVEIQDSAITIALDRIDITGDQVDVVFKDSLPSADKTVLDGDQTGPCGGLIGSHSGEPLPDPTTEDGIPLVHEEHNQHQNDGALRVTSEPRMGSELIRATHNLADKTTWFDESVRVTDEVATGSGTTWSVENQYIIDLVHGKILNEDTVVAEHESHGYAVVVTVDDVEKTMRPPFATDWTQGGDYYVEYAAASNQIVFQDAQTGTVKVSYSYASGSGWKMAPTDGKMIRIEQAEAQFSADAEYNSTIRFFVTGYVIVFAPDQAQSNGGPLPDYDRIIIDETKYKTLDQLVDEAIGAFPEIPVIAGPRGTTQKRYGFPFKYSTTRDLYNTYGMELWVALEDDVVFGGERASATFYCTVTNEVL